MVFVFFNKDSTKNLLTSLLAERDEIKSLFERCDVNRDGKLSKDEVRAGFQRLQSRFPDFRTQRAFMLIDKNGDGYISKAELEQLVGYALDCYEGTVALRLIK